MSDRAQAMLFEAFARSFFARPAELSAAELIAMFHYYFLGNPEGIGFDAPDTDYLTCHLGAAGGAISSSRGAAVAHRHRGDRHRSRPRPPLAGRAAPAATPLRTRHLVLALDPGALRALLGGIPASSPRRAPQLAARVGGAAPSRPPFAVSRLWLDRDVAPERATFNAVSREPTLDSITVYSRLERPSAAWAARTGGSVVELHSYACAAPDADAATARMRAELAALWPETADALVRAPAAAAGGHRAGVPARRRRRPGPRCRGDARGSGWPGTSCAPRS